MKVRCFKLCLVFILTITVLLSAHEEEKINLQLRWFHQFQFAGYYAAEELGYYEQAGLDVNIIEGGVNTDVTKEVLEGRAEYGVQTPSILVDRANGQPVVVLAAIFQHSPVALIVDTSSGIKTPADLVGKRIMLGEKNVEIRAMLSSEGILNEVEILGFTGDYNDIISGKVDGATGYITDVSYIEDQTESTFSYIRPLTYGIDFYGDCLFTTRQEMKKNQNRTLSFREASLKGWKYAMANPEEIIDLIIRKYKPRSSREQLHFEYEQMKKLIYPELVEIGHMNAGRWRHITDTFQKLGIIKPEFDIKGFLYEDHIKQNNEFAKTVLSFVVLLLFSGLIVLYIKYVKEKKKEEAEELRHRSELEKSEARFRGLIEFGADGILLGSHEGFIIDVNEMACSIIGMKREDLVGKFVTAVPFTKESLENRPLDFDLLKKGEVVVNERDLLRPDGTLVNIEMKTKMMADGTYQSIFRDITEKKNAEREIESLNSRFEYVLGATKTGFDIIDEENNVIYVDPVWAKTLGDHRGKKCYQYFMGMEKQCPNCAIPEALKTGITTISEEYLEKENRFIEVHTISLNEKINGRRLVAEFNIDITEKKNIERKLREFNAELEKQVAERTLQLEMTNKELESFSYSVSHDLRAPVRHIIGFTDIFLKENSDNLTERSRGTFNKITSSAQRMERLIDDLLKFSRTGRQEILVSDVKMGEIIKNVMKEYKDCKDERNVEADIGEMPLVKGDRILLSAVWENLIDNACKYTKGRDPVLIEIKCKKDNGEYIFSIKDNGVGFDPEFKHKLFGVFQRLHLEKDFPGTGIGLANVRRIIYRHGGRTWAESEGEDKGAVFYFSLPITRGE
ncbi:MAG: ABC transporter substrate-binding protein [Candidatus Delongbacteria bacterium]|nr:ABC transporter substrate-binding protein [Candidatus Delongbacteria bacterium]